MTSAFFWQNSISLCPASFCTPRPNLPVTPGVSWLPTFAFQSPIMRRTSFWGVSSLSGASLLPQMVKNLPVIWETQVWSLRQEDPLEKSMATHSVFLPGEFHGQRSLAGYSPKGRKDLDVTEWLIFSVIFSYFQCGKKINKIYLFTWHTSFFFIR